MIGACPAIFSDDGAPLGPVVPFVLLEAIEGRLPAMAVDDLPGAEAGVARLLEAVLSRPDGHWLGRAWLQQIILLTLMNLPSRYRLAPGCSCWASKKMRTLSDGNKSS